MEPVSAFALAGTIVTFVDFSSKLFSGAKELYEATSGNLSANEEVKLVILDVKSVILKISSYYEEHLACRNRDGTVTSTPVDDFDVEEAFMVMCQSANDLATDLLDRFEKLEVPHDVRGVRRGWISLWQAVSSAWTEKERGALLIKLKNLRDIIELRIIFSLRKNVDILSFKVSQGFARLDHQTQYIISALMKTEKEQIENLSGEFSEQIEALIRLLGRFEMNNNLQHQLTRELISSGLNGVDIESRFCIRGPSQEKERALRRKVGTAILRNLHFEAMYHRFEEVAEAHQRTFNWIFHNSRDDQKPWSNFAEWLRSGQGVYWVQGKAGAGKSTLLKYVCDDPRTKTYLKEWAGGTQILIASFFFWLSGTREQKSQQGLLRSLLFEILNQEPDLIPVAFPLLWARQYIKEVNKQPGFLSYPPWSIRSLKYAFTALLDQHIIPLKLCLFVDGLDEFDGDAEELCSFLRRFASRDVKLCVASRPWIVFTECFKGSPSLRLQDLTRPDIELYVDQLLTLSKPFRKLSQTYPTPSTDLVKEIVDKADGVFLWVVLVVRSLLSGIRNRDSIPDLLFRLRSIPKELEPLFSHLLSLIEPNYLSWTSKTFQIIRAANELNIPSENYTFGWSTDILTESNPHESYETCFNSGLSIVNLAIAMQDAGGLDFLSSSDGMIQHLENLQVQITARCAGFLEVWCPGSRIKDGHIHYLHRTARDYILKPVVWARIVSSTTDSTFSAHERIFHAHVEALVSSINEIRNPFPDVYRALLHARLAEDAHRAPPFETYVRLDRVMTKWHSIHRPFDVVASSRHWGYKLSVIQELPPPPSFRWIAAMFGLSSYLAVIPKEVRIESTIDGATLLHFAIPRISSKPYIILPKRSLINLLTAPENPDTQSVECAHRMINKPFELNTPWQQAIAYARGQQARWDDWTLQARFLDVMAALLQAGADPHAQIQVNGGFYSVNDLIKDIRGSKRIEIMQSGLNDLETFERVFEDAKKRNKLTPKDDSLKLKIRQIKTFFKMDL